jgi:subtilisin-like proprotein convertase family protein
MTAVAPGYAPAKMSGVVVAGGNPTTQNFVLTPVNILTPNGATIISESIQDGVLDPGETVTVSFSLKNTGGAGASTANLWGALQAEGGVLSPGSPQAYGVVSSGGPAVSMPFTFRVDPNFLCGQKLTATLALSDGAVSHRRAAYTFLTSLVEARYTGLPVPIPDNDARGVNIPLAISGFKGNIHDLDFKIGGTSCSAEWRSPTVGLNHPNVHDLTLKLRSPGGTIVQLLKPNEGGTNFCQTVLDDDALNSPSIQDLVWTHAPFTGTYRPANPLSAFDGENPNGQWILNISDTGLHAEGYMRAFSLILSPHECTTATYSISGQVKVGASGTALAGVTMTLTSPTPAGFAPRTVPTDASGNYTLTNLPAGRNYTLKPAKIGYNFTPASKSYTSLSSSQMNQNFTAAPKTYTITGKVTKAGTTVGIGGVTMTLTSAVPADFAPRTVESASTGVYTFTNLPAGRNYAIEPTKTGYTFNPVKRSFLNLSASQVIGPATNFTGTSTTALTLAFFDLRLIAVSPQPAASSKDDGLMAADGFLSFASP